MIVFVTKAIHSYQLSILFLIVKLLSHFAPHAQSLRLFHKFYKILHYGPSLKPTQLIIIINSTPIHPSQQFGAMDIEIDRERIVNQFKRNGHYLNKASLQLVSDHLRAIHNPQKRLDEIVKKMNEIVIMDQEQFNDGTLRKAIQLLNHRTETGKSFSSYQKFLEHLRKWTIFYVSPYESNDRFFVDKPDPNLFKFDPEDFLEMNKARFKSIREYNTTKMKNSELFTFIGVLYEKYEGDKNKIMLQNQINEVQLTFPPNFVLDCFLIPGCVYVAEGDFKSKDIQLSVHRLQLPLPLPSNPQNLLRSKLKLVCDNISLSKSGLDFTVQDFRKYEFIFNKGEDKTKPILIFGNVKITSMEVKKIKNIILKFPHKIQCLILFIDEGDHQKLDLKKQLSEETPIFIVPNINSEGPRILPKIPILKNDFNAKIVTNPARFSIQGRQCLMLNYPLVKSLFSKTLIHREQTNVDREEIARKVSGLLYSQNNIAPTNKIFWKQSSYFNINSQDIIFTCDKACPQINYEYGKGNFVSVGNFQREGDFVCFMPHIKQAIQLCDTKNQ